MPVTTPVFDPARCCSTGLCGRSVDPELPRLAADVDWLQQQGVSIERFNLSQQPAAFADTPAVTEALAALAGVVVKKLEVAGLASHVAVMPWAFPQTAQIWLNVFAAPERPRVKEAP